MKKSLIGLAAASLFALAGCIGDGDETDGNGGGGGGGGSDDLTFSFPNAFPNLTLDLPVALLQAPDDDSRWFVVDQDGFIRVFDNDEDVTDSELVLDISSEVASVSDNEGTEMGLLGMAFHPDFPADPRVFLYYTTFDGGQRVSRVSSFVTDDGGDTLDPDSEIVLLSVPQPQSNHKGGNMAFHSGLLYIGLGDGGGDGDEHGLIGSGQNTETRLGKIIRIDVGDENAERYTIPAGNPFEGNDLCNEGPGTDDCPEIFAWGFRNPWRWSFDEDNDELWVGDVGQNTWEEVDIVDLAGNYGWRCREGAHEFNSLCGDANPDDLIDPIVEYGRDAGFAVIGGYVYRGANIPDLRGRYVFGDLGGNLWHIDRTTEATTELVADDAIDTGLEIVSFAQDIDGELYIIDNAGTIHRIEAE
jgi:glucose/arabinose dehydrogenase